MSILVWNLINTWILWNVWSLFINPACWFNEWYKIPLGFLIKNSIEMSSRVHPTYFELWSIYTKVYYKIYQTNLRFNLGNKNIFLQEDRDNYWTVSCCPFYFGSVGFDILPFMLLCCLIFYTRCFIYFSLSSDTLWLCWFVNILLSCCFTFTVY